jgi:hypothetical protein
MTRFLTNPGYYVAKFQRAIVLVGEVWRQKMRVDVAVANDMETRQRSLNVDCSIRFETVPCQAN